MIWRPLERDIDPRDMIVSRVVRLAITRFPEAHRETVWQEAGYGGVRLHLRLDHAPSQTVTYQGRAAMLYVIAGEVVEGREGARCEGQAVLDLKTRAFLSVTCRLIPVGRVSPAA